MNLWLNKNYPIIISCAKELSRWTEREVLDMGYRPIEVTENTVVVRGDMRDVMKLNLRLRTAHRVLVPLLRAECRNIRDLYNLAASIDWENILEANGYFSVSSIVHNYSIRDTRLPSLYTKDAIADRMREKCQQRPDSGKENGRAAFQARIPQDSGVRADAGDACGGVPDGHGMEQEESVRFADVRERNSGD